MGRVAGQYLHATMRATMGRHLGPRELGKAGQGCGSAWLSLILEATGGRCALPDACTQVPGIGPAQAQAPSLHHGARSLLCSVWREQGWVAPFLS